ncbi:copper-binding protein [Rhodoferax mekongensis]|uniref:Copper-binding protein n=1 Tax=Rhodoferax mekongensis TaxID=3068341 RepID=A0ABZ0B084_9BURK|nr:copper-binding protein [Rhodoferax sp. TBRC 17307]WNO05325.1 copper-binding protein [Rhodoferax sp. TBRC 17307]
MTFSHLAHRAGITLATLVCAASVLAQETAGLAQGEIRKVDKAAAKITIKHGDIPSIAMPPMTMVFGVKDAAWLESAKAGDKIRFDVVQEGGKYIVTRLEADR